ncbi:MAG: putative motility protein [Chthonomonas sp.]|nr:putative motility protein [Chthonomonas sp.]
MKVDGSQLTAMIQALQPEQQVETMKTQVQASLLRKTLDTQTETATELLKMLEGKGQVIDIRA